MENVITGKLIKFVVLSPCLSPFYFVFEPNVRTYKTFQGMSSLAL